MRFVAPGHGGRSCRIRCGKPQLNLPENFNSFLQIGTVNYIAAHGELVLCYDQAQARAGDGNQWAARVADIEGDQSALFAALARTQHDGATSIGITRVGP